MSKRGAHDICRAGQDHAFQQVQGNVTIASKLLRILASTGRTAVWLVKAANSRCFHHLPTLLCSGRASWLIKSTGNHVFCHPVCSRDAAQPVRLDICSGRTALPPPSLSPTLQLALNSLHLNQTVRQTLHTPHLPRWAPLPSSAAGAQMCQRCA